jgi:hypothetical protein
MTRRGLFAALAAVACAPFLPVREESRLIGVDGTVSVWQLQGWYHLNGCRLESVTDNRIAGVQGTIRTSGNSALFSLCDDA